MIENYFPLYKILFMTSYISIEKFKTELKNISNYEKKYPLLNSYLFIENDCKELIKYLPDFNKFVNFMIDNYSFKITREEASHTRIIDLDIYKNNQHGFKNMFEKFVSIWNCIGKFAKRYQCTELAPIYLNEDLYLHYFLNDNSGRYHLMYIATALENFISWQNKFLDDLIENLKDGGILHSYVKSMEKTIDVQNAKDDDVLNFDEINECLFEKIYENGIKNKGSYDFGSMEKFLGQIILEGKVKFNTNLKFVTYSLEGFTGDKSGVFADFISKYETVDLNIKLKQKIYDKYKKIIKNTSDSETEKILTKILSSIQALIYYLTLEKRDSLEEIYPFIQKLQSKVNLENVCIQFFNEQDFKIYELTAIYSFFEFLCFKIIANSTFYLNHVCEINIDENTKKNILEFFEEKEKQLVINKACLAAACRKLISRYLAFEYDFDINDKRELRFWILREEFWPKENRKNLDLIENDLNFLNKYDIYLKHCYDLYNLLGGDETHFWKGINLNNEVDADIEKDSNKVEEDSNKMEVGKIIKKPKKIKKKRIF